MGGPLSEKRIEFSPAVVWPDASIVFFEYTKAMLAICSLKCYWFLARTVYHSAIAVQRQPSVSKYTRMNALSVPAHITYVSPINLPHHSRGSSLTSILYCTHHLPYPTSPTPIYLITCIPNDANHLHPRISTPPFSATSSSSSINHPPHKQ